MKLVFYVDDDRYDAPSLVFVEAGGEARARELAEEMMGRSPHYRGIEVHADEARLFGIGSCVDRSIAGAPLSPPPTNGDPTGAPD